MTRSEMFIEARGIFNATFDVDGHRGDIDAVLEFIDGAVGELIDDAMKAAQPKGAMPKLATMVYDVIDHVGHPVTYMQGGSGYGFCHVCETSVAI